MMFVGKSAATRFKILGNGSDKVKQPDRSPPVGMGNPFIFIFLILPTRRPVTE